VTARKRSIYQNPQGAEGIYLEEAYKHRMIVSQIDRLFLSWGYLPVQTPVVDFYDLYQPLLEGKTDTLYRLIDREGDLLLLRNDITLFLAKQMGLALSKEDLPVRVSYSDIILRHQDREDIAKNEFFQTGAELIGKEGPDADLEILALLFRTIETLGIKVFVHLGSKALFLSTFGAVEERNRAILRDAVTMRQLRSRLPELKLLCGEERSGLLCDLYEFIGSADELERFIDTPSSRRLLTPDETAAATYLITIHREIAALGFAGTLRIDLSEIGNQPYHTGIVFQVYMDRTDSAVAAGGRYDKLLSNFGFPSPSVGFSLLLRKIESHVGNGGAYQLPEIEEVREGSFAASFRKAEEIRKRGRIAVL